MRRRTAGFTLIELMVVIAIIGLLIGLLIPALRTIRTKANETRCRNNLKQLHLGLRQYHSDHEPDGDWFPYRLTYLYPDYVDDPKAFLCPFDRSKGTAGARKDGKFAPTWETSTANGMHPCSFMYEFSGAELVTTSPAGWNWLGYVGPGNPATATVASVDADEDGKASWGEVKWVQFKEGDVFLHAAQPDSGGWSASLFPVIRCFWEQNDVNDNREQHVVNQSMEGRPYWSAAHWEDTFRN